MWDFTEFGLLNCLCMCDLACTEMLHSWNVFCMGLFVLTIYMYMCTTFSHLHFLEHESAPPTPNLGGGLSLLCSRFYVLLFDSHFFNLLFFTILPIIPQIYLLFQKFIIVILVSCVFVQWFTWSIIL